MLYTEEENKIRFIVDEEGSKEYAIIPYLHWEEIQKKLKKLEMLESIQIGFQEIKTAKEQKRKLPTLKEFLNEC